MCYYRRTLIATLLWGCHAAQPCGPDGDGDGFAACDDCDDGRAFIHPDADESCNGFDDDCDGNVDENASDAALFYPDVDHDGVGRTDGAVNACETPLDHVRVSGDCIDTNPDAFPGNVERCDGRDQDCDGLIDEDPREGPDWFIDADADGFGDWRHDSVIACAQPAGRVDNDEDCDDADAAQFPGAPEACLEDADCDGVPRWCPFVGEFHASEIPGMRIDAPDRLHGGRGAWKVAPHDATGDGLVEIAITSSGYSGSSDDAVTGRGAAWVFLGDNLVSGTTATMSEADFGPFFGERRDALGTGVGWAHCEGVAALLLGAPGQGGMVGHAEAHIGAWLATEPLSNARYDYPDGEDIGWVARGVDFDNDGCDDFAISDDGTRLFRGPIEARAYSRVDASTIVTAGGARSVADLTGDGINDILATNVTYSDVGDNRGANFIFAGPVVDAILVDADADASVLGQFNQQREGEPGEPADFDGDGYIDLVTMSSYWPAITDWTGPGRVNVMKGPLSGVSDTGKATWTYSGSSYTTKLGIAAISPDLDGDGSPEMVAACRENDDARGADGGAAGAAYIFYGALPSGDYQREDANAVIRGDNGGAHLGRDVMATLGDLDGDGTDDIIVGSNGNTDPEVDLAGQFFIFFGASAPDPE